MGTIGPGGSGGLAPSPVLNIKDYGAKCDVAISQTGSITNGSATLTDTAAAFTSALIGKVLWINGAVTTATAVPSSTTLTMATAATYTAAVPYATGTDDAAAITATFAALPANGGTILVPGLAFDSITRTFNLKSNISIRGTGGRIGPGLTKGAGFTGGGRAEPASGLIHTGSSANPYLGFKDSLNITLTDMAVLYAQTAYTGDLVAFQGTNGTTPGMFFDVARCLLAPLTESPNFVANSLINLSGAVFVTLNQNAYGGAKYQIIGKDPNAAAKGLAQFSNAVVVNGGEFANVKTCAILNPVSSWQFYGVTFEPRTGAVAGALICDSSAQNVLFSGCGFWDVLIAGGTWIKTAGTRLTFRDCYFQDAGNGDTIIDASTASTKGLIVEGCQFDGYSNPTGQTVVKPPANGSGFTLTSLWFKANVFTAGPTDPTSALAAASTVTFAA